MIFLYPSRTYLKNLAESPEERVDTEKKIKELGSRNRFVKGMNKPKWYDKGLWVLKQMGHGKNSRVIFQEIFDHKLGDDYQLIIIRDYISQKKYEPYWRARIEPMIDKGDYLHEFPLDDDEKQAAIRALSEEINKPPAPKEEVPKKISDWLWGFSVDQHFSIYESPSWSKHNHLIQRYQSDLFQIIRKVIMDETDIQARRLEVKDRSIWEGNNEMVSILYERTGLIEERGQDLVETIFLHSWWPKELDTADIEKARAEAISYHSFRNVQDENYTRDLVSKGAYRGYPSLIFKQNTREVWDRIQTNSNKSNLALAPEQEDILHQFYFPKFINGQAGSGKSEMLMYLFAELCFQKECDNFEGDIIFLTENEELLERAILDTIEKLTFNSQYSGYKFDKAKIKGNFNTFRGLIIESLLDEEQQARFKESKYVNFSLFKQRYQESNLSQTIKRRYPAEIVWFIIMTYIRGYDPEKDELTPDEFSQKIPKKERSYLDADTFREVFDKIWKGFYKKYLEQTDSWDRISLVRHVLHEYRDIPTEKKYTVIVCDEAQDFTKVELQLLIKLSRYSDYDLSKIDRVPIIFAGDPFQTVNPTGFNLTQIKNLFWSEIVDNLQVQIDVDNILSNLQNNYRSTPEIVNLSNVVQYIRHKFLSQDELDRPQTPRKNSNGKSPSLFRLEESESAGLEEKLKYSIFIAPCNQGEEYNFKQNDDWLEEEMVLKSAALAKGSEYPVVCIYKFGEEFVKEFGEEAMNKLLSNEDHYESISQGDQFKINFFFNKLYVAITRAQEELFILDTSNGSRFFWKLIRSHSNLKIEDGEWKKVKATEIYSDGNSALVGSIDFKVALRNAENDKDAGLLYEDTDKMRDAAKMYSLLGSDYNDQREFCLAKALEFERNYKEAGDRFRTCAFRDEGFDRKKSASNCYWIGGYWTDLLDLHGRDADKEIYKLRNAAARLMLDRSFDIQILIDYPEKIQKAIREDKSCAGKIDWESKFYECLVDYIKVNKKSFAGRTTELAHALDRFDKKSENINTLIAELYFEDKNYQKALEKWQEVDNLEHQKYWRSAAETYSTKDPDKAVYYLHKLKEEDRIIEIYYNRPEVLHEDSLMIIVDILYNRGDDHSLSVVMDIYFDRDLPIRTLFDRLSKERKEIKLILVVDALTNKFVSLPLNTRHSWPVKDFVSLVNMLLINPKINILTSHPMAGRKGEIKSTLSDHEAIIKTILSKNDWVIDLILSIIRVVAHSSFTPEMTSEWLANASFNVLQYTNAGIRSKIEPLEAVAFVNKVFKRFADQQRLYTELESFLLRDDEMETNKRMIIERRFWRIRYDINARENQTDKEIEAELDNTKRKYSKIKFQINPPSLSFLRELPDYLIVDELREDLDDLNRKAPKLPQLSETKLQAINSSEDMREMKSMISHLSKQMDQLVEENKALRREISELRDENKILNKRNQDLQDKLFKYL